MLSFFHASAFSIISLLTRVLRCLTVRPLTIFLKAKDLQLLLNLWGTTFFAEFVFSHRKIRHTSLPHCWNNSEKWNEWFVTFNTQTTSVMTPSNGCANLCNGCANSINEHDICWQEMACTSVSPWNLFIHSFIFSNCLGVGQEYTLDGTSVYHRSPYTRTFTHSFTPRCNLVINSPTSLHFGSTQYIEMQMIQMILHMWHG